MKHLNGNLLCSVDIETTGTKVGIHDIVQICVMPLDGHIKPHPRLVPFEMKLKPERIHMADIDAMKINKLKLANLVMTGMEPLMAADLFGEWFAKLGLAENKRISPLAQNWPFDKPFIEEWLGPENFAYHFDGRFRDTMSVALFLNDRADIEAEQYPFPKVNLKYLASCCKVPFDDRMAHDAIYDCMKTAEIYHALLRTKIGLLGI